MAMKKKAASKRPAGRGREAKVRSTGGMVKLPRLNTTLIGSDGTKYYPSEKPIEVPYNVAFTHGLLRKGADKEHPMIASQDGGEEDEKGEE